jgi:hypothetical protein
VVLVNCFWLQNLGKLALVDCFGGLGLLLIEVVVGMVEASEVLAIT